tara:strand:- start:202 stop:351 length:150 start_codon:yes stop_codon:yes gene_type:complete
MKSPLIQIDEFPKKVKSIFIGGKRYSRKEFIKAQNLEKRRGKNGRFKSL